MLLFNILITVVVFSGAIYYVEKGTYDQVTRMYLRPDGTYR